MPEFPLEDIQAFNSGIKEREAIWPSPEFHEETLYDVNAAVNDAKDQRAKDLEERSVGIMESIRGAWTHDTFTGAAVSSINEKLLEGYDPNFKPEDQTFVPQDDMESYTIAGAQNQNHYNTLKDRLLDRRKYHTDMEAVGWGGSLTFGAIADIGNFTSYLIPGSAVFNRMKGVKKVLAAGTYGTTVNTLETAGIDALYHDRTIAEYVATAALGFGMGAAFSNLGKSKDFNEQTGQGIRIKEATETFAKHHTEDNLRPKVGGEDSVGAARLTIDKETMDAEHSTRMQNDYLDPTDDLAVQTYIDLQEGLIPKQDKGYVDKLGMGSQGFSTQTTDNALLRKVGYDLAEKPETDLSRVDKHTASLEISLEEKRLGATYGRGTVDIWNSFTKTDPELAADFGKMAFKKMHVDDFLDEVSEAGNKLLDDWVNLRKSVWEDIVRKGNSAGVEEFADIEGALKHTTRQYDPAAMHELGRVHGEDNMIGLFKKSLLGDGGAAKLHQRYIDKAVKKADEYNTKADADKAADPVHQKNIDTTLDDIKRTQAELDAQSNSISKKGLQLEGKLERLQTKLYNLEVKSGKHWTDVMAKDFSVDAVAASMAKQTWRRMIKRALSPSRDSNLLSTGNQTLMRDLIIGSDMSTAFKDAAIHLLETNGRDNKGNLTKTRMGLDMNAEIVSPVDGMKVSMMDMFQNDVGAGEYMHMRYFVGRTAMANQGPQYKSMKAIQKNRDAINNHGHAKDMHADDIKKDMDSYDMLVKQLLGEPLEVMDSKSVTASRTVRKLTALNSLGKLGFPQAGEFGRGMAAVGVKNIFQAVPVLAKFIKDAATGKLNTDMVRNMEDHLFGTIGDDYFINHPKLRGEDLGTKASKFENGLNKLGYIQGKLSGWKSIHTAEKKFVMNGLGQRWYREITTGKMSKAQANSLGIDTRMMTKIKDNMKTHAVTAEKSFGRTQAQNLNVHLWDTETAMFFGRMIQRKSANAIQEILIGEIPTFMNKEMFKVLSQFRTFNAASLAKQGRRDINMAKQGDFEGMASFQFSLMTAGMAGALKIAWDAGTSGDAQGHLKDNMTAANIARQALKYNGQVGSGVDILDIAGSTLMPDAWNPVMGREGYQSSGGIEGIVPGIGYVNKVARGIKGGVNLANPFTSGTKQDARAVLGFAPLQNSIIGDVLTMPLQE